MTLQQWCFSFKGRIGRRDFWIWLGVWLALLMVLFTLAGQNWLDTQSTAFAIVALLWPTSAIVVKRLHDRNKSGWWALLLIVAWILAAGNWSMLPSIWQWGIGRFIPTLICVMVFLDCGVFAGTAGDNRFGPQAEPLRFRR
ncbi:MULTISPECIES: DUF805 domain-containing protein [unclassified Brenneria]|uniref:DUF805 domain-containing protein n=1 Tax=unclassified Brenneria TaxID=2634434 RepID=UPI0015581B00|nr:MULTISPECIES: DUF805 domain-containing protein [unclassified Brenneria]MBJ7222086.1 DUF805 domain-containing protein [Brenneria sp. L3-3C-1]MEE3643330.1 DUF805 domain-containing protein [Brenneria sp. L3_3C_1]MEE3651515.1 DUF805 domain-containing protein [Brenneria sp. HEZEL_4_2_4]NPD01471.1 DUF805 domain-containing protein [Brenneria sp. hezel4-2-4]